MAAPEHRRLRVQEIATNTTRSSLGDIIEWDKGELGEDGEMMIKAEWAVNIVHECDIPLQGLLVSPTQVY